jgi:chaperonin GroES
VKPASERSPGQYAHERYRRALHRYRRRMRRPVLVACLPAIVVATGLAVWLDTAPWWYFAGGVTGGLLTVAMFTLGDPPGHIAKWRVGAEGERRTAKALRPLLRKGWTVVHDVQRQHENFDHVLVGPPGVFLLETKVRTGAVSLEGGVLTIRYPDDPDEVVTLPRLAAQVRSRAATVRTEYVFDEGAPRWVTCESTRTTRLPDTAKEKPQRGRVLAVGPGARDESGEPVPIDLTEGDEIIFSRYGGTEIRIDEDEYLILRESDVLARVGWRGPTRRR